LIKDTVKLVKYRTDPQILMTFDDDENIRVSTWRNGEFQYESWNAKKYMKDLKPTVFGDLTRICLQARTLEYIPSLFDKKWKRKLNTI
jgi:DNA polymerase III alpha subunit